MIALEELAKGLRMKPEELMKESVETFLKQKLGIIESELSLLTKEYEAHNVNEFDKMISEGRFHEEDAFEDYFKFDNLEAERDLILAHLNKI